MGNFSLDLKAFADKTNAKANAAVREIVRGVDESLVEKSPVGNPSLWAATSLPAPKGYVGGRFRANWQYGENEIPDGELYAPNATSYPDAGETVEREMAKVKIEAAGKVHYLANNLPYAQRLEDGWSKQAPAGMVALTVVEFEPIVEAAILKVQV